MIAFPSHKSQTKCTFCCAIMTSIAWNNNHRHDSHHICATILPSASKKGFNEEMYEELDWELPPSSFDYANPDRYYHYPGVTLAVHRSLNFNFTYERFVESSDPKFSKLDVWNIHVPTFIDVGDDFHVSIGKEQLLVSCPEVDACGDPILVSLRIRNPQLAARQAPIPKVSVVTVATRKLPGSCDIDVADRPAVSPKKVHFAPLLTTRYFSKSSSVAD